MSWWKSKSFWLSIGKRAARVGVAAIAGQEAAELVPFIADAFGSGNTQLAFMAIAAGSGKGLRYRYGDKKWSKYIPF